MENSINHLRDRVFQGILSKGIRIKSIQMAHRARASHIGSALSISDILSVLYGKVLNIDPVNPDWEERDRFILSKGHACIALYAALAERGFISEDDLLTYGKDGSHLMNHISHKVPGVEFSTGSLGHGLPFGVGKAKLAKLRGKSWKTFVLLSDGEMDEGSNWEALLFASHHKLDNLIAIMDYNKLQSLAEVKDTLSLEPLVDKIRAFGWSVSEVDGHDIFALDAVFQGIPFQSKKPSFIIAHTVKGKGVSFMENKVEWHYRSPSADDLRLSLMEIESA